MPDDIPPEIQVEIIKRLPVKSLIQFRSVSKTWKSLIDSSDFVAEYSNQLQHLLVSNIVSGRYKRNYVSIIDDDTFPQQKVYLTPPHLVNMLETFKIIGSSHGLLCLYGSTPYDFFHPKDMAVIWNVSIRKAVAVVVPNLYSTVLGFGVCEKSIDPKIVKIDRRYIGYQVEVFTLNTRTWRKPYSSNLPRDSIRFDFGYLPVTVGGCPYWVVIDGITLNGKLTFYKLIITFDMTSEEFRDVKLPDCIAYGRQSLKGLVLSKVKESLVLIEHDESLNVHVWMMEDVVSNSFTKLFTFDIKITYMFGGGFRKSGEPIIQIRKRKSHNHKLVVYEPYSKHLNNLGIDGVKGSFLVCSYEETLLLLDHQNLKVYN